MSPTWGNSDLTQPIIGWPPLRLDDVAFASAARFTPVLIVSKYIWLFLYTLISDALQSIPFPSLVDKNENHFDTHEVVFVTFVYEFVTAETKFLICEKQFGICDIWIEKYESQIVTLKN